MSLRAETITLFYRLSIKMSLLRGPKKFYDRGEVLG